MGPETALQIQIVNALSLYAARYGFVFFSVPNEAALKVAGLARVPEKIAYPIMTTLKKMGMTPGVSDLVVIGSGDGRAVALFLEVKTEHGIQSENQRIFERRIREIPGAEYHVVRSVEEVEEVLRIYGVIR